MTKIPTLSLECLSAKLQEDYKKTVIDRDNLSSQLIRRNDEVSILHEKIMILTTDMSKLEKKIQAEEDKIQFCERKLKDAQRTSGINVKFKEKANELYPGLFKPIVVRLTYEY